MTCTPSQNLKHSFRGRSFGGRWWYAKGHSGAQLVLQMRQLDVTGAIISSDPQATVRLLDGVTTLRGATIATHTDVGRVDFPKARLLARDAAPLLTGWGTLGSLTLHRGARLVVDMGAMMPLRTGPLLVGYGAVVSFVNAAASGRHLVVNGPLTFAKGASVKLELADGAPGVVVLAECTAWSGLSRVLTGPYVDVSLEKHGARLSVRVADTVSKVPSAKEHSTEDEGGLLLAALVAVSVVAFGLLLIGIYMWHRRRHKVQRIELYKVSTNVGSPTGATISHVQADHPGPPQLPGEVSHNE
eukprot:NODE_1726_length_1082_cov_119.278800_g1408_i0.p1 GENE.NODE_1726_length_1082_cov_119.278800_g1408_i0~~NODE_1726_length_1082_cov_119.278800_g1408_i0.p1  ORF type:complete len:300 (-),score=40.49 NODE_1726_length_1082_cov_119.278800_g1408_i0:55-954(-)